MNRRTAAALVVSLLLVDACADNQPTGLKKVDAQAALVAAADGLPNTVEGLITALYDKLPGRVLVAAWRVVLAVKPRHPTEAQRGMFVIAEITLFQQKKGLLNDPDGRKGPATVQIGVTKLLSLMFAAVYPGVPAPPQVTAGDAVVVLVDGNAQTAVTPAKQAGIKLDAGSTATPFFLVIDEDSTPYRDRCSGPLQTKRCQFPLFYRFTPYPYTKLAKKAKFGVCSMHSGPYGPGDEVQHDRLRLAHNRHDTPPDANGENIKIMELVDIDFLDCTKTNYTPPPARIGSRNLFMHGARQLASLVGGAVARAITPKDLYAIDRGGGGEDDFFSSFNVVDARDPGENFLGIWNGTVSAPERPTQPVTLIITSQNENVAAGDFRVALPEETQAYNQGALRFFTNGQVEGATLTFAVREGTTAAEFALTKTGDALAGMVVEIREETREETTEEIRTPYTIALTKGTEAAISPPPPFAPGGLRVQSSANATSSSGRGLLRKP